MGCAYCQKGNLDSFEAGISSLYQRSAIDDSDKSILDNIEKVKRLQLVYTQKQDADIDFKQENVVRSLDLYNKNISTDETFVYAHSNVAAAYFTKRHFDDNMKSFNLALEYLRNQKSPANVLKFEVVMLPGSKERLKLEIVTLSRRGVAKNQNRLSKIHLEFIRQKMMRRRRNKINDCGQLYIDIITDTKLLLPTRSLVIHMGYNFYEFNTDFDNLSNIPVSAKQVSYFSPARILLKVY